MTTRLIVTTTNVSRRCFVPQIERITQLICIWSTCAMYHPQMWNDADVVLRRHPFECTLTHARIYVNDGTHVIVPITECKAMPIDDHRGFLGYIFDSRPSCNIFGVSWYMPGESTSVDHVTVCSYPASDNNILWRRYTLADGIRFVSRGKSDDDIKRAIGTASLHDMMCKRHLTLQRPQFATLNWIERLDTSQLCSSPDHPGDGSCGARYFPQFIRSFFLHHLPDAEPGALPSILSVTMFNNVNVYTNAAMRVRDYGDCPPDRAVRFFPCVFGDSGAYYTLGVDAHDRSSDTRDVYRWDITDLITRHGLQEFVDTTVTLRDNVDMPANTLLLLSRGVQECLYYTLRTDGSCVKHTDFRMLLSIGGCKQWELPIDKIVDALGMGHDILYQRIPNAEDDSSPYQSTVCCRNSPKAECMYPGTYRPNGMHVMPVSSRDEKIVLHGNRLFVAAVTRYFILDKNASASFAAAAQSNRFGQLPADIVTCANYYCSGLKPMNVTADILAMPCAACRFNYQYGMTHGVIRASQIDTEHGGLWVGLGSPIQYYDFGDQSHALEPIVAPWIDCERP